MIDLNKLDKAFLAEAQKQYIFNLTSQDFGSKTHKKEIQYLFNSNIFPKFDMNDAIDGVPRDAEQLNKLIRELKGYGNATFERIYKYPMTGVGPGEIMLYFLLNDCTLGGGGSAGVDIKIRGKNFEVKSVLNPQEENYSFVKGFKIGGTMNTSAMVSAALNIKNQAMEAKDIDTNDEASGVSSKQIKQIRKHPTWGRMWKEKVEGPYGKIAGRYMSANPVIFMINTSPKPKLGEVVHFGAVEPENVFLDVVTQNVIKPVVRIKGQKGKAPAS